MRRARLPASSRQLVPGDVNQIGDERRNGLSGGGWEGTRAARYEARQSTLVEQHPSFLRLTKNALEAVKAKRSGLDGVPIKHLHISLSSSVPERQMGGGKRRGTGGACGVLRERVCRLGRQRR